MIEEDNVFEEKVNPPNQIESHILGTNYEYLQNIRGFHVKYINMFKDFQFQLFTE